MFQAATRGGVRDACLAVSALERLLEPGPPGSLACSRFSSAAQACKMAWVPSDEDLLEVRDLVPGQLIGKAHGTGLREGLPGDLCVHRGEGHFRGLLDWVRASVGWTVG